MWTEEEKNKFNIAINKYGKNFKRISKFIGNRTYKSCMGYGATFRRIHKDSQDPEYIEILRILKQEKPLIWTADEKAKFMKPVVLYRKEWQKIANYVGSRNHKQCNRFRTRFIEKYRNSHPSSEEASVVKILKIPRF